jgi:phosphoserine phosphatase
MRVAKDRAAMRMYHSRRQLEGHPASDCFLRYSSMLLSMLACLGLLASAAEARAPGGKSGQRVRHHQSAVKLRSPSRAQKAKQAVLRSLALFDKQRARRGSKTKPALELPKPLAAAVHAIKRSGKSGVAALDADGTLWGGDVGEGFFAWMLKRRYYPKTAIPKLTKAWKGYKAGTFDGEQMYELMVTGMAGMREKDVQRYADLYFRTHRHRIYRPMSNLVEALRKIDVEPWVVSGSPYWVVAAGAKYFGIPKNRVIGLSVDVKDGRLTGKVVRPVPWKWGKAKRIFKDIGKTPLVVAGNSSGDVEMLRIASELKLVINPGPKVLETAKRNRWSVQLYTANHELGDAVGQLLAGSSN